MSNQRGVMKTNQKGRIYQMGKPLSSDFRQLLVNSLIEKGSDPITGIVPRGILTSHSTTYKVSKTTVKSIWVKYCEDGKCEPRQQKGAGGGRPRLLSDGDLVFIESIKREKPSISNSEIAEKLEQYSTTGRVSNQRISDAVTKYLPSGPFSFKRITRQQGEKYTDNNLTYYQHFVDYISHMNPSQCKYFDESGFKLTVAHRNYGHSEVGKRCIEVGRLVENPNTTLNFLVSINGVCHFNFLDGASNTETFVDFFHEAANSVSENGMPSLEPGDLVIVDKCPIHRFNGELRVSNFLNQMGVGYIFLPRYSPELNIAENCFFKNKTLLHQARFYDLIRANMKVAISEAIKEITVRELRMFASATGCLNLD